MRPPEPVVVDAPAPMSKLQLSDSVCIITVHPHAFRFTYLSDTFDCKTPYELDTLIATRGGGAELKGHVAVKADSGVSKSKIDEVIQALKNNGIFRFNLITDLEEQ